VPHIYLDSIRVARLLKDSGVRLGEEVERRLFRDAQLVDKPFAACKLHERLPINELSMKE